MEKQCFFEGLSAELDAAIRGAPSADARSVTSAVKEVLSPWLERSFPTTHSTPGEGCYARHPIYCDPDGLWGAVAIVLAPGQSTPIHDHVTWGVVGVVSGREREVRYRPDAEGELVEVSSRFNRPGGLSVVIPPWDVHRIEGAAEDGGLTVSIHVYGGDPDAVTRVVFDKQGLEFVGPCTRGTLRV